VKPDIHLRIDHLMLDGVALPAGAARRLQAAVEAELGRLLTERGIPPDLRTSGAVPAVPAGVVNLAAGGSVSGMGTQIARAVYSGIGGAGGGAQ
jgi:hypothetical protein